ncbi:MAG: hypothetical protein ACFFCI_01095 [Promethearchaeota archaeon]
MTEELEHLEKELLEKISELDEVWSKALKADKASLRKHCKQIKKRNNVGKKISKLLKKRKYLLLNEMKPLRFENNENKKRS